MSVLAATIASTRVTVVLAFAYLAIGATVPNPELRSLDGDARSLLGESTTLFVFFHPEQERSLETLVELGRVQSELADRPVEWLAIVSDRFDPSAARSALAQIEAQGGAGFVALVDEGDALYGELGVRLYPSIGIAGPDHELLAYLPFHEVNYEAAVRANLLYALGEIDEAQLGEAMNPHRIEWSGNGTAAATNLRMARMLHDAGKLEKALEQALRAVEEAPSSAAAHGLAAALQAELGQCDEASESAARALELDPEEESAQAAIARCDG